jgi:hypothetical protein
MMHARAGSALCATAALLLQGCVTEALWSAHYRQAVSVTCPARVDAFFADDPARPDDPAVLRVCYRFDPGVRAPAPEEESPFPHPAGRIVLEAPEADVRGMERMLAEARDAGDDRFQSLEGSLTIGPDPARPGEAELILLLTLRDAEGRNTFTQGTLRGAWRVEDSEAPAGGRLLRAPPPGPVRLGLTHVREESNTFLLAVLTPFTLSIDLVLIVGTLYPH